MPKSRSKRRRYQAPPRLYYIDLLPAPLRDLNAINLAIGFTPVVAGLLLATRWT